MLKPLDGITVVDFTQFLSGPSATLRLADLGARVIKVEQLNKGDLTRSLYAPHLNIENDSAFYQAVNRNKESIQLNLKDSNDFTVAQQLIKQSDILVHNFRPDVMERLGLGFDQCCALNNKLIYAAISGYGNLGEYKHKPGQDLLVQAISGLTWLSGKDSDGPQAMGLAIADIYAGAQLVQGILAALLTDQATLVEISMLEAMLDFQFEPLTLYFQDGGEPVTRGEVNAAHPLVGAPYGLYKTTDGYLTLAMGAIPKLAELLICPKLNPYAAADTWFAQRDQIKAILADHLGHQTTDYWLAILEPADIWCAKVMDWCDLVSSEGFLLLDMVQITRHGQGHYYQTTRCPIRIDDSLLKSSQGAPSLGQHTQQILAELTSEGK